jgi:DNA polymerase elongation subunit (family B)
VKVVCGGIVDQLLNKRDPIGAIKFTQNTLANIMRGQYSIDKFIITKTLKETYINRNSIAHAVLADRMAKRDNGNKPMPNDRIPFVFVIPEKEKVELQGDRVDTPDYVLTNNKKIDYLYYITNQIMKPSLQFLDLVAKKPNKIFEKCIIMENNRRKGIKPVCSYY